MAAVDPRPEALAELPLWLAVGDEMAGALAPLCEAEVLRPGDWGQRAQRRPAFLLVEGGGPWDGAEGEIDRLLDRCEQVGAPALLWIATSPPAPCWLDRAARFERVFTYDCGQVAALEAAGAREPWTLWPAGAASPLGEQVERERLGDDPAQRDIPVLWLGGWSEQWPRPWRERLAAVLRGAAPRGLSILAAADLDGLPPDLRPLVAGEARIREERAAALRRAKVAIGADPTHGSAELAPPAVFEAAAAGAAAITPHDFVSFHDFAVGGDAGAPWSNMVPIVHDAGIAREEIDRLLDDDVFHREVVDHLRRIVANNHTHAHRLATLASAAGVRLVPDIPDRPGARDARDPAPA